jgi:hypothetical protein
MKWKYTTNDYLVMRLEIWNSNGSIIRGLALNDTFTYRGKTYNLVGIAAHYGATVRGGHWVSYIRTDNAWYFCNDIGLERVKLNNFQVVMNHTRSHAYDPSILVFQRDNILLNPLVPRVIGPNDDNNCWVDASLQVLFNLYAFMRNPNSPKNEFALYSGTMDILKTQYDRYKRANAYFTLDPNIYTECRELRGDNISQTDQDDAWFVVSGLVYAYREFEYNDQRLWLNCQDNDDPNTEQKYILNVPSAYLNNKWEKDQPQNNNNNNNNNNNSVDPQKKILAEYNRKKKEAAAAANKKIEEDRRKLAADAAFARKQQVAEYNRLQAENKKLQEIQRRTDTANKRKWDGKDLQEKKTQKQSSSGRGSSSRSGRARPSSEWGDDMKNRVEAFLAKKRAERVRRERNKR